MSLRRQPHTVPDYETLAVVVEATRQGRMPGMLNAQMGHYALTTVLDGQGSREVVFEPDAPHGQDYASRVYQDYFDLGIVTLLSRKDIS